MPSTATARKPAPRNAPRRASRATAAPRRATRPAPRPVPGRLVPVAVGRTAVAVGGLADSGLVARLTRSRLWIGLLAGLLVGIVGLNVMALQFNATASKTAAFSDELKRENSALRAQIAGGLSNERLQRTAIRLGLIMPAPGAVSYLDSRPGDAAEAAKRLRDGAIALGTAYVAPAPVAPEPVVAETTDAPEVTAPTVAESEAAPAPETASTPAPVAAGGAVAP